MKYFNQYIHVFQTILRLLEQYNNHLRQIIDTSIDLYQVQSLLHDKFDKLYSYYSRLLIVEAN